MKPSLLLILDRDGVVNVDLPTGVKSLDSLTIYTDYLDSLKRLTSIYDLTIVIATNQANISRGLLTTETLNDIHNRILHEFHKRNLPLRDILFCPHQDSDFCTCRKPSPGMLLKAQAMYPSDDCIFVGDSFTDYHASVSASIPFALLLTGKGQETSKMIPFVPTYSDLSCFADSLSVNSFTYHHRLLSNLGSAFNYLPLLTQLADKVYSSYTSGGIVFTAGNGGSNAHASHLMAELSVRFKADRPSIPSINLLSSSASLTAAANDFSYEAAPVRVLSGYRSQFSNSVLCVFSTSGESKNIIELCRFASLNNLVTYAFVGNPCSTIATVSDFAFCFDGLDTPVLQDLHQYLLHQLCILIDTEFS